MSEPSYRRAWRKIVSRVQKSEEEAITIMDLRYLMTKE